MDQTLYHIILRTTALTLSLVLLFISGIISPLTKELSLDTGSYLASSIGIQASVTPTEINSLSAQLEEKNRELSAREIAVSLKESDAQSEMSTFILSTALFILLVLLILNYVLDYIRAKERRVISQVYEQAA